MKILLIGATGTIGSAVFNDLKNDHQVFPASRNSNTLPLDITDRNSLMKAFQSLPKLDAVVNISGHALWKSFGELTEEDYYVGIKSKLMGQINLTHIAQDFLNPGGSVTLTTGILADFFEPKSTPLAIVNGGLHSFVMATAPVLKEGKRINVVAPGALEGTIEKGKLFAGHIPVSFQSVIDAYNSSIFGNETGKIYKIY